MQYKLRKFVRLSISGLILLTCSTSCLMSNKNEEGFVEGKSYQTWIAQPNQPQEVKEANHNLDEVDYSKPLDVDDLVNLALTHNPSTRKTWSLARSSYYSWEAEKSALYPSLDADINISRNKQVGSNSQYSNTTNSLSPSSSTTNAPNHFYYTQINKELNLSYLLLDFGGRRAQINSARQGLIAANWMHNRAIQDVIVNTLQAYFDYINQKALYQSKLMDLKDSEMSLKAAERLYQAGLTTKSDVLQANANLTNAQLNMETVRGQVAIALGTLKRVLGIPYNTEINIQELPQDMPLKKISEDVDILVEKAKKLRPDLAASYANVEQARQDLYLEQSNSLPVLSAFANLQRTSYRHHKQPSSRMYSGGIDLSIPLFEGFLFKNRIQSARERVDAAIYDTMDLEAGIVVDVITNYYNFTVAVENLQTSEDFLKYSQEAYNLVFESYKNGTKTLLDLLSAQSVLSNARAQTIQAKSLWLNSLASIAYSTGEMEDDHFGVQLSETLLDTNSKLGEVQN